MLVEYGVQPEPGLSTDVGLRLRYKVERVDNIGDVGAFDAIVGRTPALERVFAVLTDPAHAEDTAFLSTLPQVDADSIAALLPQGNKA